MVEGLRLRLWPVRFVSRSLVVDRRRPYLTLDAKEDGACHKAKEVLAGVQEARGCRYSNPVGLLPQVDVFDPVTKIPALVLASTAILRTRKR